MVGRRLGDRQSVRMEAPSGRMSSAGSPVRQIPRAGMPVTPTRSASSAAASRTTCRARRSSWRGQCPSTMQISATTASTTSRRRT